MQHKSCQHTLKRSRQCQASTKQNQDIENKNPNIGDKPEDVVDMEVTWSLDLCSLDAMHCMAFM